MKLFQRVDEVLSMKYEDFLEDYFVVKEHDIESLCAKIKGKTDVTSKHFAIWDDKECPEFSGARTILVWLCLSGIKGGYIFPSLAQLDEKVEVPTECYCYKSFLEDIKSLCVNVLNKDMQSQSMRNVILGTHMLKKTAMLFAFWGHYNRPEWRGKLDPMDEASILLDARHKDISSTMTYLGDAGTLKALVERVDPNNVRHRVGPYQPIYIKTLDNFASLNKCERNPGGHKQNQMNLHELANWYVYIILNFQDSANLKRFSIAQIFNLATDYTPDLTLEAKVEETLKKELNPGLFKWVWEAINKASDERVKSVMNHIATRTSPPCLGQPKETESQSAVPVSPVSPVSPDQVELSREYQKEVNRATTKAEKISLLLGAVTECKNQVRKGKVLGGLKRWAYRAGKVVCCVTECHGGNIVSFLDSTPNFTMKAFTCSHGKVHKATFDRSKL
jgi:hypothetical protein